MFDLPRNHFGAIYADPPWRPSYSLWLRGKIFRKVALIGEGWKRQAQIYRVADTPKAN